MRVEILAARFECVSEPCIVAGMRGHPQQAPDVFRPGTTTTRKHTSWGIQGMHRFEACLGTPHKHVLESPHRAFCHASQSELPAVYVRGVQLTR